MVICTTVASQPLEESGCGLLSIKERTRDWSD